MGGEPSVYIGEKKKGKERHEPKREHKRYVEEFNQEFQTGYQLLYGGWETTEFLGGGTG